MMPKVFRLSRALQNIGASLVLIVGLCYVALVPAGLVGQDAVTWLLVFLFTFPFAALGVYWFLRHSGGVILTEDAIIVRHFQFEQRMAYGDVVAFQEKDAHLPPNYVLKSRDGVLKFSRETENFYELHELLRQRVAVMRKAEPVVFPWVLNFMPGFLRSVGTWVGVIVFILGGMTCWGLRSSENVAQDVFFIALTAILVSAMAIAAALPKLKQKPRELVFTAEEIQLRTFGGTPQIFKAAQIQDIRIEERVTSAWTVHMAWQRMQVVLHPLTIKFRDGKYLVIEEGQAWQTGYSPERLLDTLRQLYKPQKLGAQLLGTTQNRPRG